VRPAAVFRAVRFILLHPLNKGSSLPALMRYLRWQVGSRLVGSPVAVPFVGTTRLLVRPGMQGATGNHYVGLQELEPMGFVLHVLRPSDLFVDVGANVGTYTVIGAGACKTRVVAFEPVPATATHLGMNVRLNDLVSRVEIRQQAAGARSGTVLVSIDRDTTNRVIEPAHAVSDSTGAEVSVVRLDDLMLTPSEPPGRILMKIDVEGYEVDVLCGAVELLADPRLLAVIIEINGSGAAFGNSDEQILEFLATGGLFEVTYDPIARHLHERGTTGPTRIFIRDIGVVLNRIVNAPRVKLGTGGTI
jgi:FkbM family methyltransferase